MIIAIDGPSGTGKSTVARGVANKLNLTFFDTGAMYRSFAKHIQALEIDPEDEANVEKAVESFEFEIHTNQEGERSYFVSKIDVTKSIRTSEVSAIASVIAKYAPVRKAMVKMQRQFGLKEDAVFEGRDMGTVVFPDADLKIFLTASPKVRAKRRFNEIRLKFPDLSSSITLDQILEEIEKRDSQDQERKVSPLKQAEDAILIDTSNLTTNEVIKKIVKLVPRKKSRLQRMKFSYFLVYSLARLFFKICFRLKIYGEEHLQKGTGLLIANHTSLYDPPVLSISCPEEVHFLAKASLFRIPLLGPLIRVLNSHPVSHGAGDMPVLRQMIQLLKEKKKLIIFPEGRRSQDGKLQEFEKGLFFLAKTTKGKVYPAYIQGAFEAWPIFKKLPKVFGKMRVVFGSAILWDEFEDLPKEEKEQAFNQRCFQAIEELRIWLESGAEGTPP